MNGAEQSLEAERLAENYKKALADVEAMPATDSRERDKQVLAGMNARALLDKAQVHATLAVAAELREANEIARRANERYRRGFTSLARDARRD